MKKTQETTVKKGDQTAKQPPAQPTFLVIDIRSEWNPTPVPDSSTDKSSDEEAFLKELEEKFGSKEEAEKLFSRFSKFRQKPLEIPKESVAQSLRSNPEDSKTPDPTRAETGPNPDIAEVESSCRPSKFYISVISFCFLFLYIRVVCAEHV